MCISPSLTMNPSEGQPPPPGDDNFNSSSSNYGSNSTIYQSSLPDDMDSYSDSNPSSGHMTIHMPYLLQPMNLPVSSSVNNQPTQWHQSSSQHQLPVQQQPQPQNHFNNLSRDAQSPPWSQSNTQQYQQYNSTAPQHHMTQQHQLVQQ